MVKSYSVFNIHILFLDNAGSISEFIVTFKKYHVTSERVKLLVDALQRISGWSILKRKNLASEYPSDFDLVQIPNNIKEASIAALLSHSSIKRVSPQQKVFRTLKYVNETESDRTADIELPRFTGRSSLSSVIFAIITACFHIHSIIVSNRATHFGILLADTQVDAYCEPFHGR